MKYCIQKTSHYYGPSTVKTLLQDWNGLPELWDSRERAQKEIDRLDEHEYRLSHNESGRPELRVVKAPEWAR
jgi:hypothetical protein